MDGVRCTDSLEHIECGVVLDLAGVMIRAMRNQDDTGGRAGRQLLAHPPPPLACCCVAGWQVGAKLVTISRQMEDNCLLAAGRDPATSVTGWPARASVATPE